MVDDMGWKDVGFMGSNYYETSNIDKLADQGIVFTNAYANAPNCAPSRACLMTGKYTPRHGIYTVNNSDRGESRYRKLIPIPNTTTLDNSFVTLAETMRSAGYLKVRVLMLMSEVATKAIRLPILVHIRIYLLKMAPMVNTLPTG